MEISYTVNPDITKASTIDARFYHDAAAYALSSERIFARTWQWIGNLGDVATHGALSARELLSGLLNEPLLLARDKLGALRCLSNVCTASWQPAREGALHRGTRSRFYRNGRYSPTRETGTHHFHRLLCEFMRRFE